MQFNVTTVYHIKVFAILSLEARTVLKSHESISVEHRYLHLLPGGPGHQWHSRPPLL